MYRRHISLASGSCSEMVVQHESETAVHHASVGVVQHGPKYALAKSQHFHD